VAEEKLFSCSWVAWAFAKLSSSYVGCPSTQLFVCPGNYGPSSQQACRKYLPVRHRCKHVASLTLRLTWRDDQPRS